MEKDGVKDEYEAAVKKKASNESLIKVYDDNSKVIEDTKDYVKSAMMEKLWQMLLMPIYYRK